MTAYSYLQILDSRGNPTLQGTWHKSNPPLRVAVPSGASTGAHEAIELRDGTGAYDGKSVHKAIEHAERISEKLDWDPADVAAADKELLAADGTPNKAHLGANATLCVSMLQANVQAFQHDQQLYELLAELAGTKPSLPMPFANIINGGKHAGTRLRPQEFMVVPWKATTFAEATLQVAETVHALKRIIAKEYGTSQTGVGDEGGFAPDLAHPREACDLLMRAMKEAGHDLAIAMDPAASEFYVDGRYEIEEGKSLDEHELTEYYCDLLSSYPIISLEDPFEQDAFGAFANLRRRIAELDLHVQVVGDDLTVTNPTRIQTAIEAGSCDCLLLKPNQIGTITESLDAAKLALEADWHVMVSHRSGETTDTLVADLATALGCGQLKCGAPVRGERTAKYNRLLTLESEQQLPFSVWGAKQ